ncbi:hypothetical protein LTR28_009393 [Elasticomyces elasticus]|nr:hypothetical protein LTR28_009393 [Elasticomyces elasticus]
MPPNQRRRADRAKRAKDTVNRVIPDLFRASPRARHGPHRAELVVDPPMNPLPSIATPHGDAEAMPDVPERMRIHLQCTDTLTAAAQLARPSSRPVSSWAAAAPAPKCPNKSKIVLLNMASPLRAGGGFLDGANGQEEFLCMRTTLYPSLWDDFYRLPDVGGVYTPDVLVYRDSTAEAGDLPKTQRYFVDVISAGMLRFPQVQHGRARAGGDEEEEAGSCSCGVSYCDRDRELVTRKMRAVLRMAQTKRADKLVLGAWGCGGGALANPVKEVARLWKKVLCGSARDRRRQQGGGGGGGGESWHGIRDVVFAIADRGLAREFEKCFADELVHPAAAPVEPEPEPEPELRAAAAQTEVSDQTTDLVAQIAETELEIDRLRNLRSKARLRQLLAGLNERLLDLQTGPHPFNDDDDGSEREAEEEETAAVPFAISDIALSDPEDAGGTKKGYYDFDEDDVASSDSETEEASEAAYTFGRFAADEDVGPPLNIDATGHAATTATTTTTAGTVETSRYGNDDDEDAFDRGSGWFAGSIKDLSLLLGGGGGGGGAWHRRGSFDVDVDVDEHVGSVFGGRGEGLLRGLSGAGQGG